MPTIPEAPLKVVVPEEHARPPCRGCVLRKRVGLSKGEMVLDGPTLNG